MKIRPWIYLLTLATSASFAGAEEYILRAKNLDYNEAISHPGIYGNGASIVLGKAPAGARKIEKTPKAVSANPLTSELYQTKLLVFFDESQGTGKGYDRMVVDLNENGDLTDDPVFEKLSHQRKGLRPEYEFAAFGPVELPASKAVGPWRPRFFAEFFLYSKQAFTNKAAATTDRPLYVGSVRVRAANYLTTSVELSGARRLLGILDGNCNFKIGDLARLNKYQRSSSDTTPYYYLDRGDAILADRNGSGEFEGQAFIPETEAFAPVVYFSGKPYLIKLAADLTTVQIQPYQDPLIQVGLNKAVTQVVLARETKADQWEIITPEIKDSSMAVPAGKYRLPVFQTTAKDDKGEWVRLESTDLPNKLIEVAADKPANLEFGPALKLGLTSEKQTVTRRETTGVAATFSRLLGKATNDKITELRLNVTLTGTGGERYNSYSQNGTEQLPPPKFEIMDTSGRQVATDKFEYG